MEKGELLGIAREELENATPLQDAWNAMERRDNMIEDNWKGRNEKRRCCSCMSFVPKLKPLGRVEARGEGDSIRPMIGRCRRHAPRLEGWPVVFANDWCGDYKMDEGAIV